VKGGVVQAYRNAEEFAQTVQPAAVYGQRTSTRQIQRAQMRPVRQIEAQSLELGHDEALIEWHVVGDEHGTPQKAKYIPSDFREDWRFPNIASGDPVDTGRANVPFWVYERRIFSGSPARAVDPNDRDLDNSIIPMRAETCRLDIRHGKLNSIWHRLDPRRPDGRDPLSA
jgi:hypothetical protein